MCVRENLWVDKMLLNMQKMLEHLLLEIYNKKKEENVQQILLNKFHLSFKIKLFYTGSVFLN